MLVVCEDGNQQAAFVAHRVTELHGDGIGLDRMAVLYRSHFHALELQLEFTRRRIPFSITSGTRFFEQAHIKDVAAYLKLVSNPSDELAFKRLAQMLPGIGGKGAARLWQKLSATSPADSLPPAEAERPGAQAEVGATAGVVDAAAGSAAAGQVASRLQRCSPSVPAKARAAWSELAITLSQLETEPVRSNPRDMIRLILEAGYKGYLEDSFANYRTRLEDLEQLANFASQFKTLEEFLTQLSLLTNVEAEDGQPASSAPEQVRLSTVHQAKGLEFDVVFVIMLCDGLFPSSRSTLTAEGEEEERRLFYVAITRARNELYLSYPLIRLSAGAGSAGQKRSRFLNELPRELVEEVLLR
jgi:DNA helicase-2/ATP-dependent DNA helicase PcrA